VLEIPVAKGEQTRALQVRVRGPEPQQQILERLSAGRDARAVEVSVPASWLVPGGYTVELDGVDGRRDPERLGEYNFSVR
jgi:hypothetical protein